jgi:hypothetical protein
MISFFWQRGFYYNRKLFFYNDYNLYSIRSVRGIGFTFWKLYFLRCDGFKNIRYNPIKYSLPLLRYSSRGTQLTALTNNEQYLLNVTLFRTFPVLMSLNNQLRLNILFYFFTNTYKGYALRFGKPLKQKTRARTYFKKNMKKPPKLYKQKTTTSRWF